MRKIYYFMCIAAICLTAAINMPAKVMAENGKTVYGVINRDDDFFYGSGGAIVKFDANDPYNTVEKIASLGNKCQAGAMGDGKYYVIYMNDENEFGYIDFEEGSFNKIKTIGEIDDMTYDTATKTMYGITSKYSNTILYSIDCETGENFQAAILENVSVEAIAADGKGSIYALTSKKLLKIDMQTWTPQEIGNTNVEMGNYYQSMEFDGETLYWSASVSEEGSYLPRSIWATINTSTGEAVKIGDATFPSDVRIVGISFTAPSQQGNQEDPNIATKVVTSKLYGDSMGTTEDCTQITTNFYDGNNNLVRSLNKGLMADKSGWLPMSLSYYIYNEKAQLTETYNRQYGLYDGQKDKWGKKRNFVYYEYDENGKVIKKTDAENEDFYEYTWEGDNQTKEIRKRKRYDSEEMYVFSEITYSDFLPDTKNCPQKVVFAGEYQNYVAQYRYNDNNKPELYVAKDPEGTDIQEQKEWRYDEKGRLIETTTYNSYSGELSPYARTRYTINDNETKIETDEYFQGKWTTNAMYYVEITEECNKTTAPANLTVTNVSTQESPNTVKLVWEAPAVVSTEFPAWDVYRNGEKIAQITEMNEGKLEYTDKNLVNDNYDYFIQTIDNETEETFNVSNAVNIDVITELLPVTNVKCISYQVKEVQDPMTGIKYDANIATLTWDAPETPYEVLEYNVFVGGAHVQVPEVTTSETTAEVSFAEAMQEQVFIETVYSIGKVRTEVMEFDLTTLSNIVEGKNQPTITVENGMLFLNTEYSSLTIFTVNGLTAGKYKNTHCIDLSDLASGLYIARIENNGKSHTIKIIKK